MLARQVPNGAREGQSRLPERHQPRSIASTACPAGPSTVVECCERDSYRQAGGRCRFAREMVCRNGLCAG